MPRHFDNVSKYFAKYDLNQRLLDESNLTVRRRHRIRKDSKWALKAEKCGNKREIDIYKKKKLLLKTSTRVQQSKTWL